MENSTAVYARGSAAACHVSTRRRGPDVAGQLRGQARDPRARGNNRLAHQEDAASGMDGYTAWARLDPCHRHVLEIRAPSSTVPRPGSTR
jgi:hypothetical protein